MSDFSQVIVDLDATDEEAGLLARKIHAWLATEGIVQAQASDCVLGEDQGYAPGPRWLGAVEPDSSDDFLLCHRINGLSIRIGRQVFDAGGNGIQLTCTSCKTTFEAGSGWGDAVGAWYDGDNEATYACPSCGATQRLTEWGGPFPWGFGSLGFEFWRWPPLSAEFVRAVGQHLQHRTILVRRHV